MPTTRRRFLTGLTASGLGLTRLAAGGLARGRLAPRLGTLGGAALAAVGFPPGGAPARAEELSLTDDPFTLGIASGYPEPAAVVLWTRLAPEPFAPDGGMPAASVAVEWEVAADERFRQIVRRGRTYATPDWAHSVHTEVTGLMPGREYWYRFRAGGQESPVGRTHTAPPPGTDVARLRLGLACCQHYENGHYAAYRSMADDDLDLIVHVGDYIYEDRGVSRVRAHDASEAFTLDDYRLRYAIYKSDPLLMRAHASCPWLVTSDDHEVDNDYADWHSLDDDPAELFLARRAAAYRAYYEHMPLPRRAVPFGAHQRLHTRASVGNLADIYLLDGRQYRSDQACGNGRVSPCAELYDGDRTMLGRAQADWLDAGLARGSARFTLLAQQTVFAQMDQAPGPEVGYWSDGWSGYPAARAELVGSLARHGTRNPIVLSGDIHAFLVNDVHARAGDPGSAIVATELVTTSVSSAAPPQSTLDAWRAENANVRLARSDYRGYTRLTLGPDALNVELVAVDDVARADSGTHVLAKFTVEDGRPGVVR